MSKTKGLANAPLSLEFKISKLDSKSNHCVVTRNPKSFKFQEKKKKSNIYIPINIA